MQEVFEKIKKRIRIVATEACGYTPLTRVVSESELKDIIEHTEEEYKECTLCYAQTPCEYQNKDCKMPDGEINDGWIPVSERLPKEDKYILMSFSNFSVPVVGRYQEDEYGGAFYVGDEDETCVSQDLFVNAWQPLPEPYKSKGE